MIGNKLKELRMRKGFTIVQLCKELEMNQNTYAKYERDERDVSTDTLAKLADFYEVTTDYLLGREDEILEDFSLTDKLLEEQVGALIMKFYRSIPFSVRKDFLEDAKKLFDACKEEFSEQPRESTMEYVGTIGEKLAERQ